MPPAVRPESESSFLASIGCHSPRGQASRLPGIIAASKSRRELPDGLQDFRVGGVPQPATVEIGAQLSQCGHQLPTRISGTISANDWIAANNSPAPACQSRSYPVPHAWRIPSAAAIMPDHDDGDRLARCPEAGCHAPRGYAASTTQSEGLPSGVQGDDLLARTCTEPRVVNRELVAEIELATRLGHGSTTRVHVAGRARSSPCTPEGRPSDWVSRRRNRVARAPGFWDRARRSPSS